LLALPGGAGVFGIVIGDAPWERCNDGSRMSWWRAGPLAMWWDRLDPPFPLFALAFGRCQPESGSPTSGRPLPSPQFAVAV